MDARESIEIEYRSLQRIFAILWAMAGVGSRKTILRSVYRAVMQLLRPAEAAARRLIVVLAAGIVVNLPPPRAVGPRQEPGRRLDDWKPFALAEPMPRFLDQSGAPQPFPGIVAARADQEISGARLALRLDALCHALDDLAAQAQRLARWQARRRRARQQGVFCTTQPLRLGLPADLRGRAGLRLKKHELFGILKHAHEIAWWAQHSTGRA